MGILKGLILVAAMMLTAGLSNGYAQNNSANPYINSWHRYQVNSDASANRVSWWLQSDETLSPVTRLDLSALDAGGASWITIGTGVGTDYIDIKFVDAQFNSGQTWYLIFSEWDNTAGTGNCIARRSTEIVIQENTFYLSLPGDDDDCNGFEDDIWANTDNITLPMDGGEIGFTINMHKETGLNIRQWSFNGSINITGFNISMIAPYPTGTTDRGNNWSISNVSVVGNITNFTLTVLTPSLVDNYDTEVVSLNLDISGPPINDTHVVFNVTAGDALSGSAFDIHTDDNLLLGGDREYVIDLWGIPNTSLVSVVQN